MSFPDTAGFSTAATACSSWPSSSTSTTTAATPNSVKTAYDLAGAAVPKSTVTTAGDLILGTGASAVTRLAAGTSTYVLTSNGAGVAPTWQAAAGGVPTARTISTTAPLAGGGDLSANRTLSIADGTTAVKGAVQLD